MPADDIPENLLHLRRRAERTIGDLDELLRDVRRQKGQWTEAEVEYWLHPALHRMLGAIIGLAERMTNLEDMVLRAARAEGTMGERWRPVAYVAGQERQDDEAGLAALWAEEMLIRTLTDLERPVTPVDRANIAVELLRVLDGFIGQENKLRLAEGRSPIPPRHEWGIDGNTSPEQS